MGGQLAEPFTVRLDGSGSGSVRCRPRNLRTTWQVASVQVKVSSNTAEPVAQVYLGSTTGQNLGGTYTGSNDSCTDLNIELTPGQYLTVQWTGGDANATATATVVGRTSTWGKDF